jgi:Cu/Ag efflux pump CusA
VVGESSFNGRVRRIVDWQVTNRILAVPGVSQVLAYGGDIRQYQVLVEPAKLKAFNVSCRTLTKLLLLQMSMPLVVI